MPISEAQYAELMENTEQVITARNLEEYLVENPGPYPPPPDPTYAEWLPVGLAQFVACVQAALGTVLGAGHHGLRRQIDRDLPGDGDPGGHGQCG